MQASTCVSPRVSHGLVHTRSPYPARNISTSGLSAPTPHPCSSTEIQNRCVSILAKLYHAPSVAGEEGRGDPVGTATVGSSEAIMLGALALKKAWQTRRKAKGLDTSRPNLVMGRETHVCWEK